jgi:DNA-binding response OmpR family regulator
MRILIVDDDIDLVNFITYALGREGYDVVSALDGEQALTRWRDDAPDLILLDGNLPKVDGFEVCRRIRRESTTPVIMLTVRDEERDVIEGLDAGADDYVTKPFSAKQLAARIRAVMRRTQREGVQLTSNRLSVGDIALDVQSHEVTKGGKQIELTRIEFRLLHMLALNEGRVVPYSRLVEYAWGYFNEASSALLKSHVTHIRKKLQMPAKGDGAIKAVIGVGYSLTRAV